MSNTRKPYIIGISGGTASGKSTLASRLADSLSGLRLKLFHMDDYFKPESVRPKTVSPVSGKVYFDDNGPETIYHERLRGDLAAAAGSGEYDVILIEGLFALWYDWLYAQLDLKLFVDCQADERAVRRLRRNMTQMGMDFEKIAEFYLDMVRYQHEQYVEPTKWRADIILNGAYPSDTAIQMLSAFIQEKGIPGKNESAG